MKKVLFVGDINIDLIFAGLEGTIQPDREISCAHFSRTMGSSAAITAVAFSLLGGSAGFCGLAGDDDDGRFMLDGLKARGIDTSMVDISSDIATGVTLNIVEGRMRSQVTYPGTIPAFDGSRLTAEELRRWDHIHFTGVYQQESFRPRLLDILRICRRLSIGTSLDTQWDSTEEWSSLDAWLELIDYLFVNRDEALSITGESDEAKALDILFARAGEVIVKLGADGAIGASRSAICRIASPDVTVVDTTGAGDTFAAGFLHRRLNKGANFADSMTYASSAAAFSCTYSGGVSDSLSETGVLELSKSISPELIES